MTSTIELEAQKQQHYTQLALAIISRASVERGRWDVGFDLCF